MNEFVKVILLRSFFIMTVECNGKQKICEAKEKKGFCHWYEYLHMDERIVTESHKLQL